MKIQQTESVAELFLVLGALRRQFKEAKETEPEAAAVALAYIGRLYGHESNLREELPCGPAKLAYRIQRSLPVVDAFWGWCYEQRQRIDLVKRSNF